MSCAAYPCRICGFGGVAGRCGCAVSGSGLQLGGSCRRCVYEPLLARLPVPESKIYYRLQPGSRCLLARKCPIAAKKLHLIHHGLTIEDWPFREKQTFQEVPELLFVGRFVAKKGIPLLLEALALLLQRGRRLRLTLVGSGPMEAELRQQSEQLELQTHLEWAGVLERREVGGRLRKADVFCLPSIEQTDRNQEGIPNVLVEAMAVGVPVVGSQTGGIGIADSADRLAD